MNRIGKKFVYWSVLAGIFLGPLVLQCKTKKPDVTKETPTELQQKLDRWEKNLSELENEYRKRLQIVGKMGDLAKKLAVGYTKMGRYELAAQEYHKAIQYESGMAADQTYYKKAINYYQKAFLYSKVDDDLLYQAGLVYANSSMALAWEPQALEVAKNIFTGLLKKNPRDTRSLFQLAALQYQGYQKKKKALETINRLLKIAPDDIPALEMAGQISFALGNRSNSLYYYSRALSLIIEVAKKNGIDPKKLKSYQNVSATVENLSAVTQKSAQP